MHSMVQFHPGTCSISGSHSSQNCAVQVYRQSDAVPWISGALFDSSCPWKCPYCGAILASAAPDCKGWNRERMGGMCTSKL